MSRQFTLETARDTDMRPRSHSIPFAQTTLETQPFGRRLGEFAHYLLHVLDQRAEIIKADPPGTRLQAHF